MVRSFVFSIVGGVGLWLGGPSRASANETWKIASFEWAPYLCDKLCKDEGGGGQALRMALEAVGVDVKYTFFPWSRAIRETRAGRFDGFQTAWPEDCPADFFFSETLYQSPFGVIERKAKPARILNIDDLQNYQVAVVQDYGNTKAFNELVRAGRIKTQKVAVEHLILGMVANGRVDVAVMDLVNFRFYLETTHRKYADVLQANAFVLEDLPLGICFPKAKGEAKNEKLKLALKKVDTRKIVKDYLQEFFKTRL